MLPDPTTLRVGNVSWLGPGSAPEKWLCDSLISMTLPSGSVCLSHHPPWSLWERVLEDIIFGYWADFPAYSCLRKAVSPRTFLYLRWFQSFHSGWQCFLQCSSLKNILSSRHCGTKIYDTHNSFWDMPLPPFLPASPQLQILRRFPASIEPIFELSHLSM